MEHQINEPWLWHIQEAVGGVNQIAHNIAALKASIYDSQQEQQRLRSHVSMLIAQLAKEAGFPTPYEQYSLSADGTKIIGKEAS
jgi:hypothetical protein